MKLKYIKTLIFLMIFVVFAGGLIYNYMKRPLNVPEIVMLNGARSVSAENINAAFGQDADAEPEIGTGEASTAALQSDGLININTAGQSELETLPGIGPVKAKAIIEYRTLYNGFVALEEIMEVRGIGPATYEKIKDRITL